MGLACLLSIFVMRVSLGWKGLLLPLIEGHVCMVYYVIKKKKKKMKEFKT